MARESGLPALPGLRELFHYLLDRDCGPPTSVPVPMSLRTEHESGRETDVIEWGAQDAARFGPDGFIVRVSVPAGATEYVVSAQARQFVATWAAGQSRKYEVAAFRFTHAGQERTGFRSLAEWEVS